MWAQVSRVLETLKSRISRFLSLFKPEVVSPLDVWNDVLAKRISYDGEEFVDPVPLTLEQISQSLPPLGHGGSVELEPLLVGHAKHLIRHPEKILLDGNLAPTRRGCISPPGKSWVFGTSCTSGI